MELLEQIEKIVGPKGLIREEGETTTGQAFTGRPSSGLALVRPASTEELSAVMKLCTEHKQTVVPWGGLSGLVQGTACGSRDIAISTERMNEIEEIDPVTGLMTVQAGAILQTVQEKAKDAGWQFAVDLGARGSANIGGIISTNAGGNSVVRYGMTRDQIMGLEVVLADGTILSSLNTLTKNNTGYDLKQLFVGAEGTLGFVTRAVLRLRPDPVSTQTALVAVESFDAVAHLLRELRRRFDGKLSSFEVMWQNHFRFMLEDLDGHQPFLATSYPFYILLESEGSDPDREQTMFLEVLGALMEDGTIADAVIAQSEQQAQGFWEMRDDVISIAVALNPMKSFDVSMGIAHMEAYINNVTDALAASEPDAKLLSFGHLGDENIHVLIGPVQDAKAVEEIVYGPLRAIGGSVSAEHGIGLEKRAFLSYSRNETEISVMRRVKAALDPDGLMNPGKLL